ncbi:hypothetical protein GCM10009760_36330 [Kitasatospora kazusensis]|uniref:Uncharacterized protein n=1 Tax=Kitasatospora kazusensis TaxID=407974 RepID=A0ABN2ZRQ4_9ACTN
MAFAAAMVRLRSQAAVARGAINGGSSAVPGSRMAGLGYEDSSVTDATMKTVDAVAVGAVDDQLIGMHVDPAHAGGLLPPDRSHPRHPALRFLDDTWAGAFPSEPRRGPTLTGGCCGGLAAR